MRAAPTSFTSAPPIRGWKPWVVVCGIALVWSFGLARHNYALHTFRHAGSWSLQDEGSQTLMPLLVLRGKMPYRDFEPRHTPLGYYALAGALALFGTDLYSMRLALAATNVCTALIAFAFARRAGAGRWAYLAPLGVLLWGVQENNAPVPRWMAVPAGLCACLVLAQSAPRPTRRHVAWAGIIAGCTFLTSQNQGIITLAVLVWYLCYWSCAGRPGAGARAWTRAVPLAGTLAASAVLARMVWLGSVTPAWLILAGPSIGVTAVLLWIVLRGGGPTPEDAGHLFGHLTVVGVCFFLPVFAMTGMYIAGGGWEPIVMSLRANWGGLSTVYTLPPPAPPVLALAVVAAWVSAAAILAVGSPRLRPSAQVPAAAGLTLAGTVILWIMWLPTARGTGWLEGVVTISDKLIGLTWLHTLWLLGPIVLAIGARDTLQAKTRAMTREHAFGVMAGLAAVGGWVVMYPWADYYHALWAVPAAAVAFAVLAHRLDRRVRALCTNGRGPRALMLGAATLVPLTFVGATGVKWSTYWLELDASLARGRPVARAWHRLDTQHGNILVDQQTHTEWTEVLAYVRTHTTADDPVLGLPYLPLLYVLADRPFPLYDPFWHPDFTESVRHTQREAMLEALESGDIPLIVGPDSDDTYFSLPLLRANWPDAWAALTRHYTRTARFGKYWIFERTGDSATLPVSPP